MKKRLLLITRNLPPLIGGMERLVWNMVNVLCNDHTVHVISPSGTAKYLPSKAAATEVPLRPLWFFLVTTAITAIHQALRQRPALIVAGSGLTAPVAWLAARLVGSRCIVYLHGLDIEASHPLYRLIWHPFLRHCDRVIVNSRFTQQLAEKTGIAKERIHILHPGVTLPDMTKQEILWRTFREQHSLGNDPVLLYVGRIAERKGLLPFLQNIFPKVLSVLPRTRVVVIGDEPEQALLYHKGLRATIQKELEISGRTSLVHFLGHVSAPELEAAYFAADVLIFPVQNKPGDREGFGMVAIEAAAHGLPTVAFAAGGVTDAVADGVSGKLVPAGDNAAFAQATIALLQKDAKERSALATSAQGFAAEFSWPVFESCLNQLCSTPS